MHLSPFLTNETPEFWVGYTTTTQQMKSVLPISLPQTLTRLHVNDTKLDRLDASIQLPHLLNVEDLPSRCFVSQQISGNQLDICVMFQSNNR